jgi:glutamyl-tRNA reductase
VLVVGTGEMGRLAVAHLAGRGAEVVLVSRSPDSARAAADRLGVRAASFDPGPELLQHVAGVVIALSGRWAISDETRAAISGGQAWVVDVSAPPALDATLVAVLRGRLLTIDDLADGADNVPSARLLARLDSLIAETIEQFEQWSAAETRRQAADALATRARAVRSAEVERAFDHATERLLREPLEQLGRDGDGRHVQAVRELFRL